MLKLKLQAALGWPSHPGHPYTDNKTPVCGLKDIFLGAMFYYDCPAEKKMAAFWLNESSSSLV